MSSGSSFAITFVQGGTARGVGPFLSVSVAELLPVAAAPVPRSNICPRKNKSPLSLTTGRASLVSKRALFNRRRITDPEPGPFRPRSLSLSRSCLRSLRPVSFQSLAHSLALLLSLARSTTGPTLRFAYQSLCIVHLSDRDNGDNAV